MLTMTEKPYHDIKDNIYTHRIEVNLMGKYKFVRHSFYLQQIFLYLTNFLLKTLKFCENVKLST